MLQLLEETRSLWDRLRELRPDYRLYLRRHPCVPAWDINLIAL